MLETEHILALADQLEKAAVEAPDIVVTDADRSKEALLVCDRVKGLAKESFVGTPRPTPLTSPTSSPAAALPTPMPATRPPSPKPVSSPPMPTLTGGSKKASVGLAKFSSLKPYLMASGGAIKSLKHTKINPIGIPRDISRAAELGAVATNKPALEKFLSSQYTDDVWRKMSAPEQAQAAEMYRKALSHDRNVSLWDAFTRAIIPGAAIGTGVSVARSRKKKAS